MKMKEIIKFIWQKKYKEVLVLIAIVGSIVMKLFFCASLSEILLFVTLVVIFWYSRETMDLKQISNKQINHLRIEHKTNLRPYLRLQKGGINGLILINEGKGIAVNLRPIYKGVVNREFLKIPAMSVSGMTQSFVSKKLGLELDPIKVNFNIEISYKDIEGRNYIAIFKSNPLFNDGFEIIKQEEI